MSQDQLLDPSAAARRAGISKQALVTHDDVLQPIRTSGGRRVYLAERVDAFVRLRGER